MIRTVFIAIVGSVTAAVLPAQVESPPSVGFEVASVRPNPDAAILRFSILPGDRLLVQGHTLATVIRHAFDTPEVRTVGMPAWAKTERYDITATPAAGRTDGRSPRVMAMLRRLLEARFGLKWRFETREVPIYALMLARTDGRLGSAARSSAADCGAFVPGRSEAPEETARPECAITMGRGSFRLRGRSMPQFASDLQVFTDRPVLDRTGRAGRFDIELAFAYPTVPDAEGVSLFTALQEQLGLKLEPSRGPVEVLVIDSVERPTPD
jgi:uncharacterized protein (TIGR03435 family)